MIVRQSGIDIIWLDPIADNIIELLWVTIPKAAFVTQPTYLGPDQDRLGYSIYLFNEPVISGKYTCTPDAACVLILELNESLVWTLLSRDDAEQEEEAA